MSDHSNEIFKQCFHAALFLVLNVKYVGNTLLCNHAHVCGHCTVFSYGTCTVCYAVPGKSIDELCLLTKYWDPIRGGRGEVGWGGIFHIPFIFYLNILYPKTPKYSALSQYFHEAHFGMLCNMTLPFNPVYKTLMCDHPNNPSCCILVVSFNMALFIML